MSIETEQQQVKPEGEFDGIFEAPVGSRPVMSKPPRLIASYKLIREVRDVIGIEDDLRAREIADWLADKMERYGSRIARPVFEMDGSGPSCAWCTGMWPLCGCFHLSEMDLDDQPDDQSDDEAGR
ncbi:hypothetical protein [Microbacterium sp. KNMS]